MSDALTRNAYGPVARPEADSPAWRQTRTSLAFRIAIFTFFYWRFDARASNHHFTTLEPDGALALLPSQADARHIFSSHPVSGPPPSVQRVGNFLVYTPKTFPNYYVDLERDGGFDAYLAGFSSKTRSTLKRKLRRFAELSPDGRLDFRAYRSPEEIDAFLDLAKGVSALTYQARLLDCGLPDTPAFRREALELAAQGRAYGFLLFNADRPVAYVFSRRRDGIVTYDFVGHDPALNDASPGTVLQFKLLEYLFDDPEARIFDFTEGEGPHKALFATDRRQCAKSFAFPASPRVSMLVGAHRVTVWLDHAVDRLVDRLELRQRLRRLIRRGSAG